VDTYVSEEHGDSIFSSEDNPEMEAVYSPGMQVTTY
jgi:hypothetical protein